MPLDIINLNGNWKLKELEADAELDYGGMVLDTPVPGDIHPTLRDAGKLPDYFMGRNSDKCLWTSEKDWLYFRDIDIPGNLAGKRIELVFDGLDLFTTVYVNGSAVGDTSNSFMQYRFDVTELVKPGEKARIAVRFRGTTRVLDTFDTKKYVACFYTPRVIARKAQCQFSWDWAPNLPALGIWRDVRIEAGAGGRVNNVWVRPKVTGNVEFRVELDEPARERIRGGETLEIQVSVAGGGDTFEQTVKAIGCKNLCNLKVENPKLWWPAGYGEQFLYDYKVRLKLGSDVLHEYTGRFGIREVELVQEPVAPDMESFYFKVNGVRIFCVGGNWVPPDCFPGTMTRDRYEHLIRLVRNGNFNTLRVWGGGIYENDWFYELCDQYGIMIWQDMMFACSDIPDDNLQWTRDLVPEFEQQVKRLRNHPCMLHWCGCNEKTGTFGGLMGYGDYITQYLARGVIARFSPDLSYTPASPYALTDVGQDPQTGDTHGSAWEGAFEDGMHNFRAHIDKRRVVFMSEFGLHGPPQMRSLKKFMPPTNSGR